MPQSFANPDQSALARADAWLRRHALRPTLQRRILAALLIGDGADRHASAEGLHRAAQQAGLKVSLATVYNTLKSFSTSGLICEIPVEGERSYFDTCTAEHPHFFREDTGEFCDARGGDLQIFGLPPAPEGTEISRVSLVIRLRPNPQL